MMGRNKSNVEGSKLKKKNSPPTETVRNPMMENTTKSNKSNLLNIRKPRGFTKYRPVEGTEKDFIGGDLYEVEDIINDISKIMDSTKRRVIEHNPQ